jgi:hypothetical protein
MEWEMSESRIDQGVFKIFRMTHEGELSWKHVPAPRLWQQNTDAIYPTFFQSEYQGQKLALFQSKDRQTSSDRQISRFVSGQTGEWSDSVHLALLGRNDELLFEFPPSRVVRDLFEAVRYKEANVDDFLDKLLKTESANEKE